MGKIFGISDLPVGTLEQAISPMGLQVPHPTYIKVKDVNKLNADKFISKNHQDKSNLAWKLKKSWNNLSSFYRKKK